jgi:hypothetical protein
LETNEEFPIFAPGRITQFFNLTPIRINGLLNVKRGIPSPITQLEPIATLGPMSPLLESLAVSSYW